MVPNEFEEDFVPDEESSGSVQSLTVYNVLASGMFTSSTPLNLDASCQVFGNAYYNPAEFPTLRIDVRGNSSDVCNIALFESGRIQSTGGCRPLEAKKAMLKIGRRLRDKLGYAIHLENFEIHNILAVYDSAKRINLDEFVSSYREVDYEPGRFPAVRVRIPIPPVVDPSKALAPPPPPVETSAARATSKVRRLMMGDVVHNDVYKNSAGAKPEGGKLEGGKSEGGKSAEVAAATDSKKRKTSAKDEKKPPKQEAVTASIFSTGKMAMTGAKSIRSLKYVIDHLVPFFRSQVCFPSESPLEGIVGRNLLVGQMNFSQANSNVVLTPQMSIAQRLQELAAEEGQQMQAEWRMQSSKRNFVPCSYSR